jgi:hypothetical protein
MARGVTAADSLGWSMAMPSRYLVGSPVKN